MAREYSNGVRGGFVLRTNNNNDNTFAHKSTVRLGTVNT